MKKVKSTIKTFYYQASERNDPALAGYFRASADIKGFNTLYFPGNYHRGENIPKKILS